MLPEEFEELRAGLQNFISTQTIQAGTRLFRCQVPNNSFDIIRVLNFFASVKRNELTADEIIDIIENKMPDDYFHEEFFKK